MAKTRREIIMDTISDMVTDLLRYDRREDEDLPRGAIEEAVAAGEITKAEIIEKFAEELGDLGFSGDEDGDPEDDEDGDDEIEDE